MADGLSKEHLSLARSGWVIMEDQAELCSQFTHASFYYGFHFLLTRQ